MVIITSMTILLFLFRGFPSSLLDFVRFWNWTLFDGFTAYDVYFHLPALKAAFFYVPRDPVRFADIKIFKEMIELHFFFWYDLLRLLLSLDLSLEFTFDFLHLPLNFLPELLLSFTDFGIATLILFLLLLLIFNRQSFRFQKLNLF